MQLARRAGVQARGQGGQAFVQQFQLPLWLHRAQYAPAVGDAGAALFVLALPQRLQAREHRLLALPQQRQPRLRALCLQAQRGAIQALHGLAQRMYLQLRHALLQAAQPHFEITPIRHQQLGGHRWRGCAQVGGEVGQAEVGFVAHRRHHRGVAGGDGAGQLLVVERPQIFQRATATGQQDGVVAATGIGAAQQRGELRGGGVALYQAGQQFHFQQREAPRQHAEHIAHRRAAG